MRERQSPCGQLQTGFDHTRKDFFTLAPLRGRGSEEGVSGPMPTVLNAPVGTALGLGRCEERQLNSARNCFFSSPRRS